MLVFLTPAVLSSIISGGAQAAGGIFGAISNSVQNRKSRTFAKGMYERQKNDNIEFWKMQNSYNDPSQQMERLKAAGLNPALVYGQNAGGASGAAGAVNSPKVVDPQFNPTDYSNISGGVTNAVNSMYDLRIKKQTADNLKAQNDLMVEQMSNLNAQTFKTLTEGRTGELNYKLQHELFNTQLQAAREALRKATFEADYTYGRNFREAEMHELNYGLTYEQKRNLQQQTKNLEKSGLIQDFEIMLNKMGLTRSDNRFWRLMTNFIHSSLPGKIKKGYNDFKLPIRDLSNALYFKGNWRSYYRNLK